MPMEIRKAVIPAAGWGTRFLPATKAIPKELLPLADKPVIQHTVEEAAASGIEQVIIVTSPGKGALEAHFSMCPELETALDQKGDAELLEKVRCTNQLADICYVMQQEPLGLGHAILVTKDIVGDEPFAVFLPDDLFAAEPPLIRQMAEVYQRFGGSVLALLRVVPEDTRRYGIVKPEQVAERTYRILDMVEKPTPGDNGQIPAHPADFRGAGGHHAGQGGRDPAHRWAGAAAAAAGRLRLGVRGDVLRCGQAAGTAQDLDRVGAARSGYGARAA